MQISLPMIRPNTSNRDKMSDKFSWNFYAYLKKNGIENQRILLRKYPVHPSNIYVIFKGYSSPIGANLATIMTVGGRCMYSYDLYPLHEYQDITEWFWKTYLRLGRCMFDEPHTEYFYGSGNRFTVINKNSKRCNWCGKHLRRKVNKRTIIIYDDVWESEGLPRNISPCPTTELYETKEVKL